MSLSVDSTEFNEELEVDGSGKVIYQGFALPVKEAVTSTAASIWKIQKFTYSNNMLINKRWADGTASRTKKWSLRATYQYT